MQMIADGLTEALTAEIVHLNPLTADVLAEIGRINPDVVIVERSRQHNADTEQIILELLHNHPGLYLLSMDTSHPIAHRLYSDRLATATIQELAQELAAYQRP